MAAPGFLNVTYLSGLQTGTTEDVTISTAETLVMMGLGRLTADVDEAIDQDPVYDTAPAPDV
jgi:hypothetical protein